MRLIDADELKKKSSKMMFEKATGCGSFDAVGVLDIDAAPTIDPETLRPTAHIMRGTVQCTYDAGFCSNCKLCIDKDYGTALAKSYSYCPHCGARYVK